MTWLWILLGVIGGLILLYLLGFLFFIFNGDGKMIEKVYDALLKHHNNSKREEKI